VGGRSCSEELISELWTLTGKISYLIALLLQARSGLVGAAMVGSVKDRMATEESLE